MYECLQDEGGGIEGSYAACLRTLSRRLREAAPGRIQLLCGPRQVGKTTLLLQLASEFGEQAIYAAGDEPAAAQPGYWERRWEQVEQRAKHGIAVLLLDEVHHFENWAEKLKGEWDALRRKKAPVHVVATGSSALNVASASRESLAGRFELLTLSHWPASSLVSAFGRGPAEAAQDLVWFGSYPGAAQYQEDLPRWQAYVRDAIIAPAIGRDMLALGEVRRPALLREVFAIATGFPAQIVSLQKLQGQLLDKGALETVAHYLALLQDAYLIAPLERYAANAHRRRSAPPKLVALNNALLSALHPEGAPDPEREPARFGHWLENACLGFAVNQGVQVRYWREGPLEVDAVCEGAWGKLAIEIKSGRFVTQDFFGLFEFCRRNAGFAPLVITAPGQEESARRHGAAALSWVDFLLHGPAPAR